MSIMEGEEKYPDIIFYKNVMQKMDDEGYGHYFHTYETSSTFDCDKDLKVIFIKAQQSIREFIELLEKRIAMKTKGPKEPNSEDDESTNENNS